jgi:hypothetical protein
MYAIEGPSMRVVFISFVAIVAVSSSQAQDPGADRKSEYIHAVTRGAGLMPWQQAGESEQEKSFRAEVESRKNALLTHSAAVQHPILYTPDDLERARKNVESSTWAKKWVANQVSFAAAIVDKPSDWIEAMLPMESPAHGYGFTCPVCVGKQSQEGVGYGLAGWSYTDPDVLTCTACGHKFPDPAYPETETLQAPRMGQKVTYYLNDAERANPEDRSGKLAWHWVRYPIHVSFTGLIRERKVGFMGDAARSLGFAYAFTKDVRYAQKTRDILVRYAKCYRNWLYRDYWDTYADCDPLYAAWHDKELPIEWKRHLCEDAYSEDTVERAKMLQNYWGAGRIHPSTDAVSGLPGIALAYDLTCTAVNVDGSKVWSDADRTLVERDLLLEWIIGAEPFVGGADKAENANNKSPRVYCAMASIAKCLGIANMADTALRGYECVRDKSFMYDGFSKESPSYNNMYLSQLLVIPEALHGFAWPAEFTSRTGTIDYYASDPQLKMMYRSVLWSLDGHGHYLPMSDSHVHSAPSDHIVHMGLRRFPELFKSTLPALSASNMSEYALFNLSEDALKENAGLHLPETYFPAWQDAILRHGSGDDSTTLSMALNYAGGHRHADNLALYYESGGHVALGDLGYVGDMPINEWLRSTLSHNLVVVDDSEQRHNGRIPEFSFMVTSPMASVVEATSTAYEQCSEYRRRVVLVKGPEGQTFVVDIFSVKGGKKHAFRVYSECAASDAENGVLEFSAVPMAPEPPLPAVGASLAREDIFGLRDVRSAAPSATPWQATWKDAKSAYRLWMLSPCVRVEASNGPGQRNLDEKGRRVRFLDAIREGDGLESVFVAIHEPGTNPEIFSIKKVSCIEVKEAGERAFAIQIESAFGNYLVLNDFDQKASVDGVSFQGKFGIVRSKKGKQGPWLAVGASELGLSSDGFVGSISETSARVESNDAEFLRFAESPDRTWPVIDPGVQAYVRTKVDGHWTGFPVISVGGNTIHCIDYPMPKVEAVELLSARYSKGIN